MSAAQDVRDAAGFLREVVAEASGEFGTGYIGLTAELGAALADWLEATTFAADVDGERPLEELDQELAAAVVFSRMVCDGVRRRRHAQEQAERRRANLAKHPSRTGKVPTEEERRVDGWPYEP